MASRPLQEPDYTAAMVLELPKLLNASRAFPGVRFSGCFIHQSPMATFVGKYYNPSKCEVGDFLAICHNVVDGDDRYNAAMIQWKKSPTGVETIVDDALKQLDLYEQWPAFTLNATGPVVYDIYPKTVTPGAQYGIIKTNVPEELFCTVPSKSLTTLDGVPFARFLINLMKWQTGRPFYFDSTNLDDAWSVLITNLIKASLTNTFTRRNIGQIRQDRVGDSALSLLSYIEHVEIGDDGNLNERETPRGLSLLYIDMAAENNHNTA